MKLGSIGRALVRYFRPAATSVSPEKVAETILRDLQARGMVAPGATVTMVNTKTGETMERVVSGAIAPPLDAGVDGWTWTSWQKEMDAHRLPGWGFARFGNRQGQDGVAFVFGLVRGSFGIWQQEFPTCRLDIDDDDVEVETKLLTAITHLHSGLGLGLFFDREAAAMACELGDSLGIDWTQVDPSEPQTWRGHVNRMKLAWHGVGIRKANFIHAHQGDAELDIWERTPDSISAGRPERLS